FVSHDRYFIDKLATRVFEIGGGEVHIFPGNYEDYLWRKSGKPLDLSLEENVLNGSAPVLPPEPANEIAALQGGPAKRLNPMKLQKLKDRCVALERDIERTEAELAGLELELATFKSTEET